MGQPSEFPKRFADDQGNWHPRKRVQADSMGYPTKAHYECELVDSTGRRYMSTIVLHRDELDRIATPKGTNTRNQKSKPRFLGLF